MYKISLVVLNLIGLIIQHISSLNIPTPPEQFGGPEIETGIFDTSELDSKSLPKDLRTDGCWPKKPCQSQEDCGTDGICYISYEDPYLGKIRFLSVYFWIKKCILYIWINF